MAWRQENQKVVSEAASPSKGRLARLEQALQSSDEDAAVGRLIAALHSGVPQAAVQRSLLRVMAAHGQELHSMLYVSAAFDLAGGLGSEAGKYPLCAAALQVARQPKNSQVEALLNQARARTARSAAAEPQAAERALVEAFERRDVGRAVAVSLALFRAARDPHAVFSAFARASARPEVIVRPEGYVSHLPVQVAAAWDLLQYLEAPDEVELLLAHLSYCQIELAKAYETRLVPAETGAAVDPDEALTELRSAVHHRGLGRIPGLVEAACARTHGADETGRILMRCAVEEARGIDHRFTLADAARRIARSLPPSDARALLVSAALNIAHGYEGPKRMLDVRDLPLPAIGGRDFPGRLLVALTSGNVGDAHAALRGLFQLGTSPRQIALYFLDAASQVDARKLRSNHAYILTKAAWRAIADGFFAGEAAPLLAELAAKLAAAPKDHELIERVEEAEAEASTQGA